MTSDIRIIPDESGRVSMEVYGKSSDTGLMLLQRLYTIMLSGTGDDMYRNQQVSLVDLLEGANMPSVGHLNSIIALACATALKQLDEEDRILIESFRGTYNTATGGMGFTLQLVDGTTIEGTIGNG